MNISTRLQEHKNIRPQEEGFTLIELMIVVVIIGILAAIAIPIFANQQKGAALAAVKSDVRNIINMATTFKAKNDGKFPQTCAQWDEIVPGNWSSDSTNLLRVRTSEDGFSLWIEAQPTTVTGSDPSEVRAENTIVYNSARGSKIMSRGEFQQTYNYTTPNLSDAEGYTLPGYRLAATCAKW